MNNNMTITEVMSEIKDSLDEFQRTEFHYYSKHGRINECDVSMMKRSSRRYRNALIQALNVIVNELDSVKDA